jgi:hypothetical protein
VNVESPLANYQAETDTSNEENFDTPVTTAEDTKEEAVYEVREMDLSEIQRLERKYKKEAELIRKQIEKQNQNSNKKVENITNVYDKLLGNSPAVQISKNKNTVDLSNLSKDIDISKIPSFVLEEQNPKVKKKVEEDYYFMKSTRKQKEADFQLISVQTKRRIAGLIEMKLTPNTIALFASEYEGYDPLIRLEIVEYIGFLMDKELTLFMAQVRDVPADDVTIKRRKQEFEEKAKNIRRIQDILVDPKNVREPKNSALKAGTAPKAEPKKNEKVLTKVQKDEANDKIKKMLREAEERERANARAEKEAEKRRKELEKAEKANASKKVTKEKVKKDKPAKGDNDSAKVAKEKADNEAYLRRQREVQMDKERQAREYMKREAEKEKL